ncbi:symmetrical bis(5'-nucleosyl)-tetraphosphatase [endosymbiont of Ridgeia piscesae]|jgi:bis(5'-nucleosyl)-tetraphosphatase (symmetrical)|uniref:Bis(5'-nucleosyl)-tetraphosphatase, symmetrical n=1 Tax=endosymbiont of Ridgeia piscesae TaxID=54398 RepID=A0A0T5Z3T9_9GAMM|nr:symmetrical bis(5'-nucleosyl)-tetraphosphatase [endosymbiont of Ridgeia piscesae]KRT53764.1 Bis(5'nucleosyl)-tetraphosphatase, ApaH [endosymbiont of Ridgeia piscesae]KRT57504.1 Bis(5'nucleosyl)-tetraphosphatase, ApaH [endosymbiont of Ridgeia piscesae]
MAVWAIGDIQGCYDELRRLLEQIRFDPAKDRLWFAGDLVNRGPQSLEVLRFVKSLGRSAVTVLGNHDLHLLALSQGNKRHYKHGSLEPILLAKDREELLHWLRHQRVMYHNKKRGYSIIHAGLPPQWDIPTAMQRARELEAALQGPRFHEFCHAMYGNEPDRWSDDLRGLDRLRFIANCFTRLRFCTPDGQLALREKGAPGSADPSLLPWFKVPGRASRNDQIIFGHWSTLGYQHTDNTWCVDSGCLWGGTLTALRPHKKKPPTVQQSDCTPSLTPGDE